MLLTREEMRKNYEAYKLQWMLDHGYTLSDLYAELKDYMVQGAIDGTLDSDMNIAFDNAVENFEYNTGFKGTLWACQEEWEDCDLS